MKKLMVLDSNGFYYNRPEHNRYVCGDFMRKCGCNAPVVWVSLSSKKPHNKGWRKITIVGDIVTTRNSIFISGKLCDIDADKHQQEWLSEAGIPRTFWIKITPNETQPSS